MAATGIQIVSNQAGGRRFVIPDIHGFARTFRTLVKEQLKLRTDDQLFLLGDYINKGRDSSGVLDFIMDLQAKQFQVFPIRGNHEDNLLNTWNEYVRVRQNGVQVDFASQIDALELLTPRGELEPKYARFIADLPYYYELDRFYLVHGGFNFSRTTPFSDTYSMVRIRNFETNPTEKTIVHGHQVTPLTQIRQKIANRNSIIPLDNGLYHGATFRGVLAHAFGKDTGQLCCLNLDTFELILQKNVG